MCICKKYLFWLMYFLLVSMPGISQTKIRDYYTETDVLNFRKYAFFNEAIDFEHIDFARIQAVIFFLTNELRTRNQLAVLEYAPQLENSAILHAQDMVHDNFFGHINLKNPDRKTPNDRAKLFHVTNPYLAENIIEGYGLQYTSNETVYLRGKGRFSKSPEGELLGPHTYLSLGESFIKGWMNSKDHRKNILAKEALQLGCGVAYFVDAEFNDMPSFMAVQNFQWYKHIIATQH